MSTDEPTQRDAWPRFTTEPVPWHSARADLGPRAGRAERRVPYDAAVAPRIAQADPHLSSATSALVSEAAAELARFDGEATGSATSYAALLLRTESASSSQIENLTSSPKAIGLAELGRRGRANADEIVANVHAMSMAMQVGETISAQSILDMHRALMVVHMPDAAGRWRQEQVWIGGSARSPHGAAWVAPVHGRVPAAVDDLVAFIARDDLPVLAQAALAHAQFESIHPFPDGNGRTGRALLHAQLRSSGLVRHSIVPVSAGLLGDTDRYFRSLTEYRAGDPEPIVREVCEAVFPALANSRALIAQVRQARAGWDEHLSARRGSAPLRLADLLTTRPVVDTAFVAAQLGVSTVNAQLAVDRLVGAGILVQIGSAIRDRVWQAPDVLEAMEAFAARSRRRGR